MSRYDHDLTIDHAAVTLTFKILSGLYFENRRMLILGRDIGWGLYGCNVVV